MFTLFDITLLPTIPDDKGYLRCFTGGNHPNANKGFVLAHRLRMEEHLGRFLTSEEVVHHINEIKTENRLWNLFLCSSEEHVRIHNRYRHNSLAKKSKIARGVLAAQHRKNQISGRDG